MTRPRLSSLLVLGGALLGLVFSAYSTSDYSAHLDRQVHAVHCSFIPGAGPSADADNACKTALFSPYSALFRDRYWGGVPIPLFAVGAFSFFVALGLYLLLAEARAPKRAWAALGVAGFGPLLVSAVMFTISATKLGTFCKLCVGIYASSALIAAGAVLAWLVLRDEARTKAQRPEGTLALAGGLFVALGVASAMPAAFYVSALPDVRPYLSSCGKLEVLTEPHAALLKLPTAHPTRAVTLFEDPLCPTCKGFHNRSLAEGIFNRLDVTLVLFPLDSECNWMLDRSLHPGACVLSKAILCGKDRAREILEWSFDNQEELRALGKSDVKALRQRVDARFGADVGACIDDAKTKTRLNQHLLFASNNHVPVSTPQMYLGAARICDEDTDLGLTYTMAQLAPEVLP